MLVAISGKAGSGKGVAAEALTKRGWVKVALADPMKRICRDVFGWRPDQLWGPSELRNAPDELRGGLTPRRALQLLGTEWGRACWRDVWVDYAIATAQRLMRGQYTYSPQYGLASAPAAPVNVVIDDVRFGNEMRAIQQAGGRVIRVVRPNAGLAGCALTGEAGQHASETEQDGIPDSAFDAVLSNDREPEDLQAAVARLASGWTGSVAK